MKLSLPSGSYFSMGYNAMAYDSASETPLNIDVSLFLEPGVKTSANQCLDRRPKVLVGPGLSA